jgi:hypothetical protein
MTIAPRLGEQAILLPKLKLAGHENLIDIPSHRTTINKKPEALATLPA